MADRSQVEIIANLNVAQARQQLRSLERSPLNFALNERGFTQPLGKIRAEIGEFDKSLAAANSRVLAFGASAGIILGVRRALDALIDSAINVDKRFAEININLNLTKESLKTFGSQIFQIARDTGQSFDLTAKAVAEFSRQGLGAAETLKRTKDALILSRLANIDQEAAVDDLTAAINSFNKAALTSSEIVNKFARVDANFAVSSADLAEAIKRVGSTAEQAGVSIDELNGLVTAAQQITSRGGAVIGNALKTIFTRLQSQGTIEQLRELGVEINANQTGLEKLEKIAERVKVATPIDAAQIKELAAGKLQINILSALLPDLANKYGIVAKATKDSSLATNEATQKNKELNQTLDATLKSIGTSVTQLTGTIGKSAVSPILGKISNILQFLVGSDPLKEGQTAGETLGRGIAQGISNFLTGPGAGLAVAGFGALIFKFGADIAGAFKSVLGLNQVRNEQKSVEGLIAQELVKQGISIERINQGAINHLTIERDILANIQAQVAQRELAARIAIPVTAAIKGAGYAIEGNQFTRAKGKASGYIPINDQINETIGAKNAGYQAGNIRQMVVPNLGKVIYNDREKVKYFPGLSQPAIIPPQTSRAGQKYKEKFIQTHSFDPYKNEGLIPNFANIYQYPLLGKNKTVDGRLVREDIPNLSSIGSSFNNYKVLPGLREVPMDYFSKDYKHYSVQGDNRIESLKGQISDSKELNPLIVAVDKEGPYILEGGTRFKALGRMGAKSFPAKVVLDLDDTNEEELKKFNLFNKGLVPNFVKVFHGTNKDFNIFRKGDLGFHLGSIKQANELANDYINKDGIRILPLDLNLQNPLRLSDIPNWDRPRQVFTNLARNKVLTREERLNLINSPTSFSELVKSGGKGTYSDYQPLRKLLRKKGYDGIIYLNEYEATNLEEGLYGGDSYISFYPNQIKSVFNKNPDYTKRDIFKNEGLVPKVPNYAAKIPGISSAGGGYGHRESRPIFEFKGVRSTIDNDRYIKFLKEAKGLSDEEAFNYVNDLLFNISKTREEYKFGDVKNIGHIPNYNDNVSSLIGRKYYNKSNLLEAIITPTLKGTPDNEKGPARITFLDKNDFSHPIDHQVLSESYLDYYKGLDGFLKEGPYGGKWTRTKNEGLIPNFGDLSVLKSIIKQIQSKGINIERRGFGASYYPELKQISIPKLNLDALKELGLKEKSLQFLREPVLSLLHESGHALFPFRSQTGNPIFDEQIATSYALRLLEKEGASKDLINKFTKLSKKAFKTYSKKSSPFVDLTELYGDFSSGLIPNYNSDYNLPNFVSPSNKYTLGYSKFRPNIFGLKDLLKEPKKVLSQLPFRIGGSLGAYGAGLFEEHVNKQPLEAQQFYSASKYIGGFGGVRNINLDNNDNLTRIIGDQAKNIITGKTVQVPKEKLGTARGQERIGDYYNSESLFNTIGRFNIGRNKRGFTIQDAFDFDNSIGNYSGKSEVFDTTVKVPKKINKFVENIFKKFGKENEDSKFANPDIKNIQFGPLKFKKALGKLSRLTGSNYVNITGGDLDFAQYGSPFLTRIKFNQDQKQKQYSGFGAYSSAFSSEGQIPNYVSPNNRYTLGYSKFRPNIFGLKDLLKEPKKVLSQLPFRVGGSLGAYGAGLFTEYINKNPLDAQSFYSGARYLAGFGGKRNINLGSEEDIRLGLGGDSYATIVSLKQGYGNLNQDTKFHSSLGSSLDYTVGGFSIAKNKKGITVQDPFDFDNSRSPTHDEDGFASHESKVFSKEIGIPAKYQKNISKIFSQFGKKSRIPSTPSLRRINLGPITLSKFLDGENFNVQGNDLDFAKYGSPFLTRIKFNQDRKQKQYSGFGAYSSAFSSEGHIPNYARMLGSGASANFFDLEKRFKGINIGKKVFNEHRGAPSEIENEFKIAKVLEKANVNPLFYFPKTIGSLTNSIQKKRIGKEVFPGRTPFDINDSDLIQLLYPFQASLEQELLEKYNIEASDFTNHTRNTVLNEEAEKIFTKITSKESTKRKLLYRLNDKPNLVSQISNALSKKGAKLGVIDPGLFYQNENYSDGLVPNYASLFHGKKIGINKNFQTSFSHAIRDVMAKERLSETDLGDIQRFFQNPVLNDERIIRSAPSRLGIKDEQEIEYIIPSQGEKGIKGLRLKMAVNPNQLDQTRLITILPRHGIASEGLIPNYYKTNILPRHGVAAEGLIPNFADFPINEELSTILERIVKDGGKPVITGGSVRDYFIDKRKPKDFDVEVFGLEQDRLIRSLSEFGKVDEVGKSFGVLKLGGYDFSLPRTERKTGVGHKGFEVVSDPNISYAEGASRRDLTINSIGYDYKSKNFIDPYGGIEDIGRKVLKPVSPKFKEDPLRVLRAAQFSSRFGFDADPKLIEYSKELNPEISSLPKERVFGEFQKIATKSKVPSKGLRFLEASETLKKYPQISRLRDVPQNPVWHPEGDVLEHTFHVMDAMNELEGFKRLDETGKTQLMFTALGHDFGKFTHTKIEGGKITSPGHEKGSVPIFEEFLQSIGAPKFVGEKATPLIAEHGALFGFKEKEDITPTAVRRLAQRINPANLEELELILRADKIGRPGTTPKFDKIDRVASLAKELNLQKFAPKPIVQGRDLLNLGVKPSREMGEKLKELMEAQLEGKFNDVGGGIEYYKKNLKFGGSIPNFARFDTRLLENLTRQQGIYGQKLPLKQRNLKQLEISELLSKQTGISQEELLGDKYFQDEFRRFVPNFGIFNTLKKNALSATVIGGLGLSLGAGYIDNTLKEREIQQNLKQPGINLIAKGPEDRISNKASDFVSSLNANPDLYRIRKDFLKGKSVNVGFHQLPRGTDAITFGNKVSAKTILNEDNLNEQTFFHELGHVLSRGQKLPDIGKIRKAIDEDKLTYGNYFNKLTGISTGGDPYEESFAEFFGNVIDKKTKVGDYNLKKFELYKELGRQGLIESKGLKSNGLIPNFAISGVSDSINREIGAGIHPSQVRIGKDSSIKSPQNPLGLGVFNTRDEPGGLKQGINRAIKEGRNPRVYNVPGLEKRVFPGGSDVGKKPSLAGGRVFLNRGFLPNFAIDPNEIKNAIEANRFTSQTSKFKPELFETPLNFPGIQEIISQKIIPALDKLEKEVLVGAKSFDNASAEVNTIVSPIATTEKSIKKLNSILQRASNEYLRNVPPASEPKFNQLRALAPEFGRLGSYTNLRSPVETQKNVREEVNRQLQLDSERKYAQLQRELEKDILAQSSAKLGPARKFNVSSGGVAIPENAKIPQLLERFDTPGTINTPEDIALFKRLAEQRQRELIFQSKYGGSGPPGGPPPTPPRFTPASTPIAQTEYLEQRRIERLRADITPIEFSKDYINEQERKKDILRLGGEFKGQGLSSSGTGILRREGFAPIIRKENFNPLNKVGPNFDVLQEDANTYFEKLTGGLKESSDEAVRMRQGLKSFSARILNSEKDFQRFERYIGDLTSTGTQLQQIQAISENATRGDSDKLKSLDPLFKKIANPFTSERGAIKKLEEFIQQNPNLTDTVNLRKAEAQQRSQQRLQNFGFAASFAGPLLGGVIAEGVGTETRGQRGVGALANTLGNAAGFAGLGASFGNVGGAIGGGLFGITIGLKQTIKAFTDSLPDLQRELDKTREEINKNEDAFARYIEAIHKLDEEGLSPLVKQRVERLKVESLSQISSPFARSELALAKTDKERNDIFTKYRRTPLNEKQAIESLQTSILRAFDDKTNFNPTIRKLENFKELPIPILGLGLLPDLIKSLSNFNFPDIGGEQAFYPTKPKEETNSLDKFLGIGEAIKEQTGAFSESGRKLFESFIPQLLTLPDKTGQSSVAQNLNNILKFSANGDQFSKLNNEEFLNFISDKANSPALNTALGTIKSNKSKAEFDIFANIFRRRTNLETITPLLNIPSNEPFKRQQQIAKFDTNIFNRFFQERGENARKDIGGRLALSINDITNLRGELEREGELKLREPFLNPQQLIGGQLQNQLKTISVNKSQALRQANIDFEENRRTLATGFTEQFVEQGRNAILNNPNLKDSGRQAEAINRLVKSANEAKELILSAGPDLTEFFDATSKTITGLEKEISDLDKKINLSSLEEGSTQPDLETRREDVQRELEFRRKSQEALQQLRKNRQIAITEANQGATKQKTGAELNAKNLLDQANQAERLGLGGDLNSFFDANRVKNLGQLNLLAERGTGAGREEAILQLAQAFRSENLGLPEDVRNRLIETQTSKLTRLGVPDAAKVAEDRITAEFRKLNEQGKIGALRPTETEKVGATIDDIRNAKTLLSEETKIARIAAERLFLEGEISSELLRQARNADNLAKIASNTYKPKEAVQTFVDQLKYNRQDFFKDLNDGAAEVGQTLKTSFSSAFKSFADGSRTASQALKDLAISFSEKILDKSIDFSTNLFFGALSNAGSSFFGGKAQGGYIQKVPKFASGGKVMGGSGLRDDVFALLNQGEYVVKKSSVNQVGTNFLDRLNSGGLTTYRKYDSGGGVSLRLANEYLYDDAKHPTRGELNVDKRLSNFALSNEDDPASQRRQQREQALYDYLRDKASYDEEKNKALEQYNRAKKQRLIGAYVSSIIGVGSAGISGYFGNAAGAATKGVGSAGGDSFGYEAQGYKAGLRNFNDRYYGISNPGVKALGGRTVYEAMGGLIKRYGVGGPSVGTDKVPALLTGGEYVVNRDAVSRVGVDFMNKVNGGRIGYASGGYVGSEISPLTQGSVDSSQKMLDAITKLVDGNQKIIDLLSNKTPTINKNSVITSEDSAPIINLNITTNVTLDNKGNNTKSDTQQTSSESGGNVTDREQAKQFANGISSTVYSILTKELRPQGLILESIKNNR